MLSSYISSSKFFEFYNYNNVDLHKTLSQSDNNQLRKLRVEMIASALGGSSIVILFTPLLVIKTQLQTSEHSVGMIIKKVWKTNGISGFWSGTRTGLLQTLPSTILYMSTYERLKEIISFNVSKNSFVPLISGIVARTVVVTLLSPLELIRTIQSNGSQESMLKISRDIYNTSGVHGFYKGLGHTLLRDVPFSAVFWFSLELLRPLLMTHKVFEFSSSLSPTTTTTTTTTTSTNSVTVSHTNHKPDDNIYSPRESVTSPTSNINMFQVNMVAAATSSVIATTVTHPFDLIKTQIQTSTLPTTSSITSTSARSFVTRMIDVQTLFKGLGFRLLLVVPSSTIMISVYEFSKAYLR